VEVKYSIELFRDDGEGAGIQKSAVPVLVPAYAVQTMAAGSDGFHCIPPQR
jgi:hypothetical protein